MNLEMVNGEVREKPVQNQTVEFYDHAALNLDKSIEAGKRVYETKAYIRIVTRGSRDSFSRLATGADQVAHPKEWAAYSNESTSKHIPLNKLPLAPSRVMELAAEGVDGVEHLAASDYPEAKMAAGYLALVGGDNETH